MLYFSYLPTASQHFVDWSRLVALLLDLIFKPASFHVPFEEFPFHYSSTSPEHQHCFGTVVAASDVGSDAFELLADD